MLRLPTTEQAWLPWAGPLALSTAFDFRYDKNSNSTSILSREGTEIPRKRRLPVANRIDT